MFFDLSFWEDIVKNLISSVGSGIILLFFGAGAYVINKKYSIVQKISKKINNKSENVSVGNVEGDFNIFQEVNRIPVLEKESKDTIADT